MALEFLIVKDAVQDSADSFALTDETVYGTGGNPARADRANVLFVTKTDENNVRTLITIVPDTADPITVSAWEVPAEADGWYEKLLASVTLHTGQAYAAADMILYYAGVFYKTLSAVPMSTNPPNVTYYVVVPVADLYEEYLENTSIDWARLNELNTAHTEDRIKDLHEEYADKFLAGACKPGDPSTTADLLDSLLQSANSAFLNDRPQDSEVIIRGIENYYVNPA